MGLMHLSKDQDTLGRRLEGLARGIMKMFKPDPGQPDRRRLEVIGNFKEPPPLGVTIRDGGCDFDSAPPEEPAKNVGGRPPEEREKAACSSFVDALAVQNDLIGNDLFDRMGEEERSEQTDVLASMKDMTERRRANYRRRKGNRQADDLAPDDQNPPTPIGGEVLENRLPTDSRARTAKSWFWSVLDSGGTLRQNLWPYGGR